MGASAETTPKKLTTALVLLASMMLQYLLFAGQRGHRVHHIGPYLRLGGFVQHAEEEGYSRNKPPRLAVDLSTGGLRVRTRIVEAARKPALEGVNRVVRTGNPNKPAATQQRRVAQHSGACPPS